HADRLRRHLPVHRDLRPRPPPRRPRGPRDGRVPAPQGGRIPRLPRARHRQDHLRDAPLSRPPPPWRVNPGIARSARAGETEYLLTFDPDIALLFWDIDPAAIDLDAHRDYVMERVMSRGGWAAMRWLRATYPAEVRADFLRRKGHR